MDILEKDPIARSLKAVNQERRYDSTEQDKFFVMSVNGTVETEEGKIIGELKELISDKETEAVAYGIFQFSETLGLGKKLYAIPWCQFELNGSSNNVMIKKDLNFIRNAPAFNDNHWPKANNPIFNSIEDYWKDSKNPDC